MENASKALLMAAGVLIGILILSLAVYLFVSFGNTSSELRKQKEAQDLEQFNSQFTSYEGKTGITVYDVVSVASLATQNNISYELSQGPADGKNFYVSVYFPENRTRNDITLGYGSTGEQITNFYNERIRKNLEEMNADGELKQYKCTVSISPTTGRVWKVDFVE